MHTPFRQQIFLNLPVQNLQRSIDFFTALGFGFNPRFTDETATCMVVSDSTFVMLLTHEKFMVFSPRPIADTTQVTEVLISLSCESREAVDDLVRKAIAAGGSTHDDAQDHGFMYDHGFRDLDGHNWGLFYMAADAVPPRN